MAKTSGALGVYQVQEIETKQMFALKILNCSNETEFEKAKQEIKCLEMFVKPRNSNSRATSSDSTATGNSTSSYCSVFNCRRY